jgi:hypothetical protein
VSAYLLTTRVPAKGTVCAPDVVPFTEAAAATQARRAVPSAGRVSLLPPTIRRLLEG